MNNIAERTEKSDATHMMHGPRKRRTIIAAVAVVVVAIAWYLFRPELLFVNKSVNEGFPAASAATGQADSAGGYTTLSTGMFRGIAHETEGTATIHQLQGGKRVLRLTGFKTSNGPDVHVYLVAADDAADNDTVTSAGFVDLGSLKGNVGDQNYDLPANLDLQKYRAVTIWCKRFGVNFGTAAIRAPGASLADEPMKLASGMFHDGAHETKGTATIYRLGGKRVLRLTDFTSSNGPDLRVYLVAAADATDSETVKKAGHIELGKLKGNVGDQNYDVPDDVDLSKHRAVTIWCARFGVNFGTAPLAMN